MECKSNEYISFSNPTSPGEPEDHHALILNQNNRLDRNEKVINDREGEG